MSRGRNGAAGGHADAVVLVTRLQRSDVHVGGALF